MQSSTQSVVKSKPNPNQCIVKTPRHEDTKAIPRHKDNKAITYQCHIVGAMAKSLLSRRHRYFIPL
jgi:hypothetical protein